MWWKHRRRVQIKDRIAPRKSIQSRNHLPKYCPAPTTERGDVIECTAQTNKKLYALMSPLYWRSMVVCLAQNKVGSAAPSIDEVCMTHTRSQCFYLFALFFPLETTSRGALGRPCVGESNKGLISFNT